MSKTVPLFAALGVSVLLQGSQIEVPRSLLAESERPVREFAMLLANASVPSGIEIRHADATYFRQLSFDHVGNATVPVSQVIDRFNTTHTDYRAKLIDGVLVIRPAKRTASFIDGPSTVQPMRVEGVMKALDQVFAQLEPSLAFPSGTVSNFMGGTPPDLGDDVNIAVNGNGRRVIDVLDDIVKQAPRTWYLETQSAGESDQPVITRIGFLLRNGKGVFRPLGGHAGK